MPDIAIASTAAAAESNGASKDDDRHPESRICGVIPRVEFLQKTLENIKDANKRLDDFSDKAKAKMELKLDWYLTLRRCAINPYPT